MIRLVSLNFQKYSGTLSRYHPYHLHAGKLKNIRQRLIGAFLDVIDASESNQNNAHTKLIEALVSVMFSEYHNICDLIIIFEKEGYYSRSVAVNII